MLSKIFIISTQNQQKYLENEENTMSKSAMKGAIEAALRSELGSGDLGDANGQISRLADAISNAVYSHITEELNTLRVVLSTPGTFVGAGTGVVTVTAPGMAAWNPGIP